MLEEDHVLCTFWKFSRNFLFKSKSVNVDVSAAAHVMKVAHRQIRQIRKGVNCGPEVSVAEKHC